MGSAELNNPGRESIPKLLIQRVKHLLRNLIQWPRNLKFYRVDLGQVDSLNLPETGPGVLLHVITIAYNNEQLLEQQVRLMKKYLADNFVFVIADNSSNPGKRRLIREICRNRSIPYISLPPNPYVMGSYSHGASMNWMCRNYLPVYQPRYFGFIDHDIYPVKKHSIIRHLEKQLLYGHLQQRGRIWYLWAGLCFYDSNFVSFQKMDFLPLLAGADYADTGGSNWKLLYRHLDPGKIEFPSHEYLSLREGEISQSDKMEMIGEWLHSFNGSYWMNVEPKENILFEYLDKL